MRVVAIGIPVVALLAAAANARAEDAAPATLLPLGDAASATASPGDTAPPTALPAGPAPATQDDVAALRAELASQQASIDQLKATEAARTREPPLVRVSGYAQVDWVLHNQASQNEVDESSGQPLNQDWFTLRRGHVRFDAQRGLFAGVLELDANTVSGLQVRPIPTRRSRSAGPARARSPMALLCWSPPWAS